jgi:DNA integrity scanning protein DisA with diadenylate cyclase activity
MKPSMKVLGPVLALGLAPFIMQSTEGLLNICFNSSLQKYGGDIAVGSMTILASCMQVLMLPLSGLSQGAQPIISYNFGAGNDKRVKEAFFTQFAVCVGYAVVFWIAMMAAPKFFAGIFNSDTGSDEARFSDRTVNELVKASYELSKTKTGALIVIAHTTPLDDIINTGDKIKASIHRRLILNLFFKNSPLHDGALIISDDKIVAARCTLPITERTDIPANYGMRHKAAIGVTEETDADAIVVSEETGRISVVTKGEVTPINNINELKLFLGTSMGK